MGLQQNILHDTVADIELRELIAVSRNTSVRAAMGLMKQKKLGCVIVVDAKGRPIGKFTERRLLKLLLKNADQLDDPIHKHMYDTGDPVRRDATVSQMLRVMESRGLRFVCVVDEQGKAVALTGQKGLMEYIADHFPRQVKVQLMESKVYMSDREGA